MCDPEEFLDPIYQERYEEGYHNPIDPDPEELLDPIYQERYKESYPGGEDV